MILPVHGIETQRIRGDHEGLAQEWARAEGRSTVCLYAADARDPEILGAYQRAGHRCVVLGTRMDAAFLWRLWTMLGRARRVVSNRLSTPVVYAAHLGADVAVYGDPLHLEGEASAAYDRVARLWPEFHGASTSSGAVKALADAELGTVHVLPPPELSRALGWDRRYAGGLMADYWLLSPGHRALTNLRRRRADEAPADDRPQNGTLGARAWFLGALSYLPRPLPRAVPDGAQEPLPVS